MIHDLHGDFSFSGLKTAVRYFLDKNRERFPDAKFMADVAASVQCAIVETLVTKTVRLARAEGVKTIMLAGGVAANASLRETLAREVAAKLPGVRLSLPELRFCTDNAAMIAMAGYFRSEGGQRHDDWTKSDADAGWELGREVCSQ
jgi:N6-L-threonylcarbamoyladenine synthase